MRFVKPCLVILVGPSGAGKSTWASATFDPNEIVSSDQLRAAVGIDQDDQVASTDAFHLLHETVTRRLARGLTTVVDTTGLDAETRRDYVDLASDQMMITYAVCFDTPADVCRARNARRNRPIPQSVHNKQISSYQRNRAEVERDGFDEVVIVDQADPGELAPVAAGPKSLVGSEEAARLQEESPARLAFGLQISSFQWPDSSQTTPDRLRAITASARQAGFESIWVMDHFRQIPQVGRAWEDMLESYTTLAYLAGISEQIRLGALVTGVTYRNPALLGKMLATLDVLSGGRAICGLGLGWFEQEARAYGIDFPDVNTRYELLEDTLQLLPLLWGPGSPEFIGKQITVPEAMCYPRPVQERIPVLVGGGGERRTLRLVARYADYCNLFGEPETVRHKVEVLHEHCRSVERDPAEVIVSHLGPALVATDRDHLRELIAEHRPPNTSSDNYAAATMAGTVEEQIGRYRRLADAGVQLAIVNLPNVADPVAISRFRGIITAFA